MISNKKAVSGVIATVLLILLVIAAIIILWAAIMPLIGEELEGGTGGIAGCIETDLKIVDVTVSDETMGACSGTTVGPCSDDAECIETGETCVGYVLTTGSVIVRRTAGNILLEDIVLFGGSGVESAQIGSAGTDAEIGIGETVNFNVDDTKTISAGDTLKVYAVISGKQCDAADTFEVSA